MTNFAIDPLEAFHVVYVLASKSPDPSTQIGAIIVDADGAAIIGHGFNEFPRNVEYNEERWERPLKYSFIEHGERNAIFSAARRGYSTEEATMFCNWAGCADCARAIIQSGITTLVRHWEAGQQDYERWAESVAVGDTMMREAGVEIVEWKGKVFPMGGKPIRTAGRVWYP